jgi:hypothetical protein
MAFMKMVSMARSSDEIKEQMDKMTSAPQMPEGPQYSYGLCITLCDDELKKLGIDKEDMPEIGDMIDLRAMAKVTSVHQSASADGDQRRIELQITDLGVEDEDREYSPDDRAKGRYGQKDEEDD